MRSVAEAARGGRGGLLLLRRLSPALLLAALLAAAAPARAQPLDTLAAGTLRVVHAPRQAAEARRVLALASAPLPLPGLGRVPPPDSTTILLAASPAEFRAATGGGAPEWAGGVAIPAQRLIVLPSYAAAGVREVDRATVLRHELAHLALNLRVSRVVPRWFDEGYAEVASGGWDVESAWQLRLAFASGAAPPLDSLALDWPWGEREARTAYLLSATAVDYLRRRGGERGLSLLFGHWREDGDFERALRDTYGITQGQFEEEWRRDVRSRYGWLALLSNVALIWGVATVLVLAAWIPRRRRNRRKLAQMEAEERMLPPAQDSAGLEYPLPDLMPPE